MKLKIGNVVNQEEVTEDYPFPVHSYSMASTAFAEGCLLRKIEIGDNYSRVIGVKYLDYADISQLIQMLKFPDKSREDYFITQFNGVRYVTYSFDYKGSTNQV